MLSKKEMNRRQFLAMTAALGAGAALAACAPPEEVEEEPVEEGEPGEVEATEPPPEPAAEEVELRIHARTGAEGEKTQMGIDAFEENNPNIKVTYEDIPGDQYADKLLTMAAGDTLGDVAFTHVGFYHAMADAGFWTALYPLIDAHDYDTSVFFETAFDHLEWDGELYGLPYKGHSGPSLLFYNKEMLAEEGIDELAPQSFDELIEIAKLCTKDTDGDGQIDQWGYLQAGHHGWTVTGDYRGFGSDPVSPTIKATEAQLNGERQMETIRWIHDLIYEHEVTPVPGAHEIGELFIGGTAAMRQAYLTSSGDDVAIGDRFTMGVTAMPEGPYGDLVGFYNHDQMAMNAKTEHVEESWKLLTYFCGKEHGIRLGLPEGGGATSCGMRKDVMGDPDFQEQIPAVGIVAEMLPKLKTHWYPDNLQTFKAWDAIEMGLDDIMLDSTAPTEADFDEANDVLQNILDEPRM